MTAGAELQIALVAAMSEVAELTGVYDGPPARADYPYAVIDCGNERPWACSSRNGREVTATLVIWDDLGTRLLDIEDRLETLSVGSRSLPSWQLSSLRLTERKKTRSATGPWASYITLRARMLAKAGD